MKKIFTVILFGFMLFSLASKAQINTYPYVETGDNPVGWNAVQGIPIWSLGTSTVSPTGNINDAALICNFFAYAPGPDGLIISPVFDFTNLSHPVFHFYVAYASYNNNNDSLQVLVSTDFGNTFVDLPTPYRKSHNQTPSYATVPSQITSYSPTSVSHWRHETIDLGAFAGQNNLLFAFRGVCAYGNNLFIDNFVAENADTYAQQNITSPGAYTFNDLTLNFNTVGLPPVSGEIENDNPGGGVVKVVEHLNQDPVPSLANPVINTNNTATTHDGSIFTPNIIAPDKWYSVSYTGNDWRGNAVYDIKIDLSFFISVLDITKLYIVKRADYTDSWECLNTTVTGSSIQASGLTSFSDFGVAGDSSVNPLPVELSSFTSVVNGNDVTLSWSTSSEVNNSGFEVERKSGESSEWITLEFINGYGSSNTSHNYLYTDKNLTTGIFSYRLKQIDFNGNYEFFNLSNDVNIGVPLKFSLSQNYPNPFNPTTAINFNIPEDGKVSIKLYDISGKEVAVLLNEFKTAGYHNVKFNASGISSGVYFYRLQSGEFVSTKKMILSK